MPRKGAGGRGSWRAGPEGAEGAARARAMEPERGGGGGGGGGEAAWFQFGFRFALPTEGGLRPAPLGEPGSIRAVRPTWSFVGLLAGGEREARAAPVRVQSGSRGGEEGQAAGRPSEPCSPPRRPAAGSVRLEGAVCAALPGDCLDVLPSESHVLVLREAAVEAWPVAAAGGSGALLEGEPAWRRPLRPEDGPGRAQRLPLVPGGYVAPRAPFFTPLPAALRARQVALGHEHALMLSAGGALFSWGGGRHGQLGHGDLESRAEPLPVEALQGVPVLDVAAGGWHSAAIGETGDLYLWGWNESGQLALPSKAVSEDQATTPRAEASEGDSEPTSAKQEGAQGTHRADFISIQTFPALVEMPDGEDVSKISCGSRHTAAVTHAGYLYTWGWGKYGQLGHQETGSSDQPRKVDCFVDWNMCVVDVVCGPWTTYALAVGR